MTNREIEKRIKSAFQNATPDVFQSVLCRCEEKTQMVDVPEIRKSNVIRIRKIASIAAAIVIVVTVGAVGFGFFDAKRVDSVISLDVNPSIELDINKKERIIKAQALNEDAQEVLDGIDFEGSHVSVAVNAIIGSMLRNGYIDELANSILISVDNKNEKKGEELKERLSAEVKKLLDADNFNGAVISQTIKKEDKTATLAEEYGITKGKAQLILQITEDNSKYEFKDLAPLTINDLNLIASGEKVKITSSGNASEKRYIGKSKAKKIALKDDGVNEESISDYKCVLKYKSAKMVYEIKFETDSSKYKYTINATSGEIIKEEIEREKQNEDSSNVETPDETPTMIDEATAKSTALSFAAANEDDITNYACVFDDTVEIPYYRVSFVIGEVEYVYDIDAQTGERIEASVDDTTESEPSESVSSEQTSEEEIPSQSGDALDTESSQTTNSIVQ